jgi:protein-tyrosine phosphatase
VSLAFQRLHNVRDLGGWSTTDGRVTRRGVLYRADSLGRLAGADLERFRALGVRTVVDLRYPWEIAAGGRVPDDAVAFHNLSIEHRPYDQTVVQSEVDPAEFFAEKYAEVASDGVEEIRQVVRLIAADAELPLAFHCKSGKDRTGIIAALVLSIVGVARDDVVTEYALSNRATPRFHAEHVASGRELPDWPGFGTAPAGAIRRFLTVIDESYGGPRAYCDVDDGLHKELRERLLDRT